ncbi:SDR family NAD(P)-dependent oxidoreductase [Arthrobacter sp. PAMC25564]|uniref:SDR family NAD(P)-dependent oxidoreductase n=1 Tax=Arthrobacter sp. PAMC25564 TaxID=2565366 RepID=UPI0010A223B9|nr:SDR family NAD(P)-dependent oxidoreductase [Arthrobacter sp. PAMC25564]QCB98087.1 SDR family NAD(P)-dependent oxidoreductase [Arthrobacter sp. PAMC25564]
MSAGRTLNVLVTGGSGPSGIAAARALQQAGFTVFTVGSDGPRIEAAAAEAGSGVTPLVCDLASLADVRALRASVAGMAGSVDGVIHLVGGWRGAKGITDQSDEDWEFLERGAITTLRNVTRVFYDDLEASDTGRFAMVSSTAVGKPTAAVASYVAAKAAAEAWTLAVADGFHRGQSGHQQEGPNRENPVQHSAAVIFVVKALVDARMRAKSPERTFPGFTDVEELAAAAVGLFASPAAELNGRRLLLSR